MYLDNIEIHGFKSFGDAVKLNIPHGITGVIGPNGSGKSNVADAIRWVLGEQSAKSLRGSKMEDIIFAGTSKRKSLGYAEVAMVIKNPNKIMSIDYSDVVIKRRIYRSGESEYFINGSQCRLKDIQELFMDTGVGKEGYSIIGQGQIDRVLSSKPEERRTLFEEAAGIYKYKVRRLEAEKKLDKERENLTRVKDILSEIEGRLEPLEKEAEKTKQFLRLKEELKTLELTIFLHEVDRLEQELTTLKLNSKNLQEENQQVTLEKENLNIKNVAYKRQKSELYENIEKLIEQIALIEKEEEKKNSQIELNKERMLHTEKLLTQLKEDQEKQEATHKNQQEKIALFETKSTALEMEKASKEAVLKEAEEAFMILNKELENMEGTIDISKAEFYKKLREMDAFKAEIQKNSSVESQLDYRIAQITENIAIMNSEIQHEEVHISVLEQKVQQVDGQIRLSKERLVEEESTKKDLEIQYETQNQKTIVNEQNLMQATRQLKWLQTIKAEHEGYFASVKQVLKQVAEEPKKWSGIIGVVGEIIEVPQKYETAIVTALGGAIQYIVTETEQTAKNMIRFMKQKNISRVTFLPKDTMASGNDINEPSMLQEEGFLGVASHLVTYEKSYDAIIQSLLGRILIVDNMDNASRIAKKYHYRYKLVTLEGEIFNAGGALSGGSTKNQSNNIFSRNREIKGLEEKVKDCTKEAKLYKESLEQLKEQLLNVQMNWENCRQHVQVLQEEANNINLELEKKRHALRLIKGNQIQLITERNNLEEQLEKLKQINGTIEEKLEFLQETIGQEERSITTLEGRLTQLKEQKEKALQEVTEKKISLSVTEQNRIYLKQQLLDLQEQLVQHSAKEVEVEELLRSYEEEKEKLLKANEMIRIQITTLEEQKEICHFKRQEYNVLKIELENQELEMEKQMEINNERLEKLREERFRLDNKKENLELQKQTWGNTIWEQYELTYNHAQAYRQPYTHIGELKKTSADIKFKIKQMGSVNTNAIEEFSEISQRFHFLNNQRLDIEKAEMTLLEMIQNLTEQMQAIFKVQFESIAKNFSVVFKELFGGGEAYLELTNPENILESGIEIIAMPPGKKLQNMTLLSGGERTLTAISLIFGILTLKPSPFCVLDEIEAALDDANVIRFADYLSRLSHETQFIVITHRKGTMERANTLYGVTMQERGVSTVLSIQLEEAKDYLENKKTS
ncbi:chromosome segregation protein SMC [Sporanaerobium hydrogeniformans]|uniref:Chromosome segregation protein SMC n=1 Tax=Sporanaerobium hydrogeniformans TaxID=3072179 RepID=A0AC61DE64_9FIRM|nr:chromosome segregation protein SMC [Sporanaerobium hydrogeniformans]PHV71113.1 chromosome segregation protein SMC [Sporanaerobium hydrogeniformans]